MSESEDRLDERLREVLEITEAPPAHLVEAAKASLGWRNVDAELAELVADSGTEPAAALRAAEPPRLLTFSSGEIMIVVEVAHERKERRVIGQMIPAAAASVEIRHSTGVLTVSTDADGRFRAAPVAAGPMSISCRFDDSRTPVVTSWVTI